MQPAPPAPPVPPVLRPPELGFVYVETMPDIGSCPGGDGPDADKICDLATIGAGDGIPEIIVGSRALRVNETNGATPPHFDDPNDPLDAPSDPLIGRGYVIDGATRAVIKRIDMPAARPPGGARPAAAVNSSPAFGRTMASPQGMPPCAGSVSESNDTGVGSCPVLLHGHADVTAGSAVLADVDLPGAELGQLVAETLPSQTVARLGAVLALGSRITKIDTAARTVTLSAAATASAADLPIDASDPRYPRAVRIGDLDGGGVPDIVITARGYPETRGSGGSAAAGSECKATTTTGTCGAGKVWVYRGEDIVNTDPEAILDTTMFTPSVGCTALPTAATPCYPNGGLQNPDAQTTGGEFGGNLFRVGDLDGSDDGIPDYVIPFRGSDFPLKNPDINAGLNMGSAYLYNGRTGSVVAHDASAPSRRSARSSAATSTPAARSAISARRTRRTSSCRRRCRTCSSPTRASSGSSTATLRPAAAVSRAGTSACSAIPSRTSAATSAAA